EQGGSQAGGSL
nr:RecName: Full=Endochitinase; AltName: Full=Chitinase; AltName: Allergen=Trip s 1 [Triplochiton scleroxylon]